MVQVGRRGRLAVRAERCGGSGTIPRGARSFGAGDAARAGLEPDRPRWRGTGRGDPARQAVCQGRGDRRDDAGVRRRGKRDPGILVGARRRDRRGRVPALDPGHGRRVRADERRRLRMRDQGRAGRMRDRAAVWRAAGAVGRGAWVQLSAFDAARRLRRRQRDVPRASGGTRRGPGGDGPHRRGARSVAAAPLAHGRVDVQEPRGPQGVGADRRRRVSRADARRRAGQRETLQLSAQPRGGVQRRDRGAGGRGSGSREGTIGG